MIAESKEKNQISSQSTITRSKSVNTQNKNDKLIDDLKKKINDLQIENDNKNKIIQVQVNQIKELEKKLINKKIDLKKDKLENLIQKLEVDRPKIIQLQNAYEQLKKAKNSSNFVDIKKAEETIEGIKSELLTEKEKFGDMYEIFDKCKKVAKLRLQREQIYEAKIELGSPPKSIFKQHH